MTEAPTAPAPLRWRGWEAAGAPGTGVQRVCAWGFAALLSVYLGLSGGGYDIVVRSEIGLVVWWFVLLGVLVGVLPHARVPRAGWVAAALLAGFIVWTWIGLAWSSSHELTLDEVCRVSTYLGVFLLGLCALSQGTARSIVNGLACGIAAVSTVAIMSKLTPGLFPTSAQGNSFYAAARLSYPFGYPDGVGEYAALGLPLVLYMATSARTLVGRALASGALQPVLLCLAMTVSRGGILAAATGVVAFFALVPNRMPRLPTFAVAAAGIAALMVALLHRPALRDSLSAAPASQRHSMLLILCVTVVVCAVAQAAALLVMRRVPRPRWLHVSRHGAQGITAAIALAAAVVVIVGFASGTVGNLWHDFKLWEPTQHSNQYFRLLSLAGSHRYQYWQVAWHAFTSSPLHGIGAGTFRYYWYQHTTHAEYILNAHSLWFETLAETGIVGWLLLAGFFGLVMIGGSVRALRASRARRTLIATSTAGVWAFCAAASFDWVWQIGVVPMVAMLLAAVSLGAERSPALKQRVISDPLMPRAPWTAARGRRARLVLVPGAVLALILIAIPLASTAADRASEAAAAQGQLARALTDAKTAQAIEPGAASPYLQQALVFEQANDISNATSAIRAAIAHSPTDYELWVIASRIATEAGHPRRALANWNRARLLYPTSENFGG
jgi:O-Antigen ligase